LQHLTSFRIKAEHLPSQLLPNFSVFALGKSTLKLKQKKGAYELCPFSVDLFSNIEIAVKHLCW